MSVKNQQLSSQRTKQRSVLTIAALALFILLSVLNDNMFLDKLLPAAGIISLMVLIHNLGKQQ